MSMHDLYFSVPFGQLSILNQSLSKGYGEGYDKGYDIGHSRGVEEGKLDAARSLLGQVSPDILAKTLELPLDTILKLKEEQESSSK